MKKILALLLTLVLTVGVCPNAFAATITDPAEISQIILNLPSGIKEDLASVLASYPSKSYVPNDKNWASDVNGEMMTSSKLTGVYQCYGFSMYVYAKLFGVHGGGSAADFTTDKSSVKLLQGAEAVSYDLFVENGVKIGAHIRTTEDFTSTTNPSDYGHSMILVSYNEECLYVYHGNADGKGTVRFDRYTWDEFNKYQLAGYRTPRRVKYIAVPKDEYRPVGENLEGDHYIGYKIHRGAKGETAPTPETMSIGKALEQVREKCNILRGISLS